MEIVTTPEEVRAFRHAAARQSKRLALVPTMGCLHEGHLSLIREALLHSDEVAVTIFINPAQFSANESHSAYPRDFNGDVMKCKAAGVTLLYAPEIATIYPFGYQTWVGVDEVSKGLCGDRRPNHFRGVATIVTKWLALFRPDVAVFGEKDYQQLQVIRCLNNELEFDVHIISIPTVREVDGLAISSRNTYLSPDERQRAPSLSQGLFHAREAVQGGECNAKVLIAVVRDALAAAKVQEDYVELREADSLKPLTKLHQGQPARLLVAGFVGHTRLIDNVAVMLP